jgi:hypothetical protein
MCRSVDPSRFLLLNINSGDKWRRPRNTLESSPSPGPRHVAFAFAFRSRTSYFYVREVLVVMGPDDTNARLRSLLSLTDMENRLTIHFALMDLRRCRADRKMLHENGPGNLPLKILSPSPRLSMTPCPVQLTVAWPASIVFASATQKSPMLMMSRGTVGMMDCLNRMTTPFIYGGVGSAIILSASIPFPPRYSPAKDKPTKARTSRVNVAHNPMHRRTFFFIYSATKRI